MSTPNRSLPGQDEQRPSFLSGSAASPQSAAPSVSTHSGETQDSLGAKRRAKQAEANARQAEADWEAKAIRSIEEADQDAISFLHSVLLSDDDEPSSHGLDSDAN
ncbi:hypothetical protein CLIM01_14629 [Colletotrichum limetticola]|uniref:Uncharacterized protein n=1 Tax=Colletotrichum limetticola TaxID=1209924 RepID=A0ABQ9P908_9PEZI|nr:hypothetical protein CLIM01_14629 [Colletotrichum limetticola]